MTIDGSGTALATCVLAPNPSPMTLEGTNTWMIAAPGSSSAVVIDPGPEDEGHLRRVVDRVTETGRRVAQILLTHGHSDHSAGARRLAALTGAPVRAADPAHRLGTDGLTGGDVVTAAGCELRVIGTPGHSADSLSLLLPEDGALLTGDTVLGRGTTVIGRDGSLADYLRSLDAMKALADSASVRVLLPGHGPLVSDPSSTLAYYIDHRAERLAEVRAALAAGDTTAQEIVARVYHDVDPAVRQFAEWSVRAQLDYLATDGERESRLPCALAQALGVDDQHRPGRDVQPAAGGKVRECLVDRLPRRPDQLRELLLRQVVVHLKALIRLLAESLRQVEQRLGDPSGNIGKDEVGGHIVGAP
jgi:glyoxylase-like metal-dependent hydrolase (beta-lactamase superfamily II)